MNPTSIFRGTVMLSASIVLAAACRPTAPAIAARDFASPAPAGSLLPQLNTLPGGDPVVSWLEPRPDSGYTFRVALWQGDKWSEPRTISDDKHLIMFSADLHGVSVLRNGTWVANWQVHHPRGNEYATEMQLALSRDSGRTWSKPVVPHSDREPGEHGFVATFPVGDSLGLVWLDQRRAHTAKDSASSHIGLWFALLHPDGTMGPDSWVDSVTCECCPNSAAATNSGPVVVYRNKVDSIPKSANGSALAVRDIYVTRLENGQWTQPHPIHADNWLFNGCPDNGPAIAARGDTVAVAWWSAPGNQPRARVVFSTDAGRTFGEPIVVDDGAPEGQLTLVMAGRGVIVGWEEDGTARARWVGFDGTHGESSTLGPAANHTRLPRWLPLDNGAYLATWTTEPVAGTKQVKMSRLELGG